MMKHAALLTFAVLGVAIAATLSGCGSKPTAPLTAPPGSAAAQAMSNEPPITALMRNARQLHPGWPGTSQWTERQTAIDSLRRIGPAALPSLVEFLHGPDRNLRELSARAIALMGPPAKAAVPDLIAALSDMDPEVRKNVIRAIGQMGPDAKSAIPGAGRRGPAA